MFVVGFSAIIGDNTFNRLHSVEIENSMKKLGKRALLKIPTTARLEQAGEYISEVETAKSFEVGDEVVISFGYDGNLVEEFRGYVRKIRPTTPLEIECEDEVYTLKRKALQKSFRNINLLDLLNFIIEDTGIELVEDIIPTIKFNTFLFKNVNAAQALEKLRKDYGLTIYFRESKTLVVSLVSESDDTIIKYTIGQNVILHNLEWEDEKDVKLKIKAVSISKDNQFTTETVGDGDGEQRTIYFYNLPIGANLKERAQEEILKYRYTGYRGSLTGFLIPYAQIGNTLRLKDENFQNNEGDYLIESIKTTLSMNGGRRKITLGLKLD